MPLRVNHNIAAINTQRHLLINNRELSIRIERLSSGLRINRAADAAAGLAVSESMRAEISGLKQAVRNAEQGVNLIQTAEGALNEVSAIMIRMRELSVQALSSTINDTNRKALNFEVTQLVAEIDRIANATTYNKVTLLTGFGNTVSTNTAASTALVSATTGLLSAQISGAQSRGHTPSWMPVRRTASSHWATVPSRKRSASAPPLTGTRWPRERRPSSASTVWASS